MNTCIWCKAPLDNSLRGMIVGYDNLEVGTYYNLKTGKSGNFCKECWERKLAKQVKKSRGAFLTANQLKRIRGGKLWV